MLWDPKQPARVRPVAHTGQTGLGWTGPGWQKQLWCYVAWFRTNNCD